MLATSHLVILMLVTVGTLMIGRIDAASQYSRIGSATGWCRERNLCCSGRDRSCAVSITTLRSNSYGTSMSNFVNGGSDGIRSGGNSNSLLGNLINSVTANTAGENAAAKECFCDSACITLGDCCPDYKDACGVIDCRVSEWEQWSECDAACGIGSMSRSRVMLSAPQNGGKECPDLYQKRACHGQRCEVQDNDKMLRETAIILLSSYSSIRNVDEAQDIRRNLRLNYPKDPLKENVNEYTVLFEVSKNMKKSCELAGAEMYAKMQEGSKVCVQCQEAAMRRHLGYRCYGHGSTGKSTRWTALGNVGCHGRWIRLDDRQAANYCGGNKNGTALNKNEPDFIFV